MVIPPPMPDTAHDTSAPCTDIEELTRARAALAGGERQLHRQRHLLAAVQEAVIATDTSGVITSWNPHAEVLYGWTAEEAIGQNLVALVMTPEEEDEAQRIMHRLRAGRTL